MTAPAGERGGMWSRAWVAVVPNALTLARLAMAAAFPFAPGSWQLGLIAAAGLSDLLDGAFSRLFRVRSTAGQVLDPLADKAFVAAVLLTWLTGDRVDLWQVVLIGARDLAVVGGSAWVVATRGPSAMKGLPPRLLGKLATAAQFALLVAVAHWRSVSPWVFYPAAVLSVLAGIDYLLARRRKGPDATAQLQHP